MAAAARRHGSNGRGILVFNPSSNPRTDVVEMLAADEDLGLGAFRQVMAPVRAEPGPAFHLIDEETGVAIPVWREPAIADSARRPAQTIRFLAKDVPAQGFRHYRVVEGDCPAAVAATPGLELVADARGLTALGEWRVAGGDYALGEVIYETIPGPFGREKLCGWGGIRRDCAFERTPLRSGPPEPLALPYGSGLRLTARDLPGSLCALTLEVVTYADLPRNSYRPAHARTPRAPCATRRG